MQREMDTAPNQPLPADSPDVGSTLDTIEGAISEAEESITEQLAELNADVTVEISSANGYLWRIQRRATFAVCLLAVIAAATSAIAAYLWLTPRVAPAPSTAEFDVILPDPLDIR